MLYTIYKDPITAAAVSMGHAHGIDMESIECQGGDWHTNDIWFKFDILKNNSEKEPFTMKIEAHAACPNFSSAHPGCEDRPWA